MRLLHKTITVDADDWDSLKSLNINLSSEIRDYLRQLRAKNETDVEGINLQLEQQKLKKNMQKLAKIQAEIQKSQENIKKIEEISQKKEEERLKKEKELIKKSTRCNSCNNLLNTKDRIIINDNLIVCKACYHSGNFNFKKNSYANITEEQKWKQKHKQNQKYKPTQK